MGNQPDPQGGSMLPGSGGQNQGSFAYRGRGNS